MQEEQPQIKTRRVRFMMVNPADFMTLFTKGLKVKTGFKIIEGLPKDARLLTMAYDGVRGGVMMVVESDTYDEIPITQMPPIESVRIAVGWNRSNRPGIRRKKK